MAWKKRRERRKLGVSAGRPDAGVETNEAIEPEPLSVAIARSELLGNAIRSRIELQRARTLMDKLLPHANDDWELARVEIAHAVRKIIRAALEEGEALDALITRRFGAAATRPLPGAYHTLDAGGLEAAETAVAAQADRDLVARGQSRAHALKLLGAVPKSLDAVIDKALGQKPEPPHG